ncbi:probable Hsp90 co-chaperone Cdc37 [Claviceps purpurea 20.1]|uniref:Hsp90 chaperone protein kinase-targeting subunit n=1 Tax=Claviceps purpurea (strain 20.1) TaxID=1111077 RepID=M1W5Y9_CLAP2|nr:probable Hsp90 co-chaperone Cdc37 [Claviceps purpurea 20.1]
MPVDYSKWDALELSDDSDIEVHPNVDKRSFIRAKQNQIHQERQQRKLQIELYKFENIIHDGLLKRISSMTAFLRQHGPQASEAPDIALRALLETNPGPAADAVPARPEGLQSEHPTPTTFSQMMATLIDEINKSIDSRDDTEKKPRYQGLIEGFEEHAKKITDIKKETTSKLEALLKEEGKKITSSDIHTGFDSSHVTKASPLDKKGAGTEVELLNPSFNAQSSSTKAAEDDDDEEIEASDAAKQFAKIPPRDYAASLKFLSQNPHILTEKETDGLLVLAFDAALERNDDYSHQCVHQALLLQYCRALGKDGVALFFKRITTKGHQAQEIFFKDVQDTYMRIKNRSREILAERARDPDGATQDVEQIQLHAVDPGTVIQIKVPAADSQDEEEKQAREIFEGFSPEMRTALESGDLDAVNKVLGKMKVEDAEELVAMFDKANILSMEEQIIDATTEDGLKQLRELDAAAKAEAEAEGEAGTGAAAELA